MQIELKRIDVDENKLLKTLKEDIDFLMKFDLTNRINIGDTGEVFTQYTADEITCAYSISNEPISFLTITVTGYAKYQLRQCSALNRHFNQIMLFSLSPSQRFIFFLIPRSCIDIIDIIAGHDEPLSVYIHNRNRC